MHGRSLIQSNSLIYRLGRRTYVNFIRSGQRNFRLHNSIARADPPFRRARQLKITNTLVNSVVHTYSVCNLTSGGIMCALTCLAVGRFSVSETPFNICISFSIINFTGVMFQARQGPQQEAVRKRNSLDF
jgi:hypothetical protein